MTLFLKALQHESRLIKRNLGLITHPLFFYVMIACLFPLGLPQRETADIASCIIWVANLMATILTLNDLFDYETHFGALEALLLSPAPLSIIIFAKILTRWFLIGGSLLLATPLLAMILHLQLNHLPRLLLSLLLGTPSLYFIGGITIALTVYLRHRGLLLSLLMLPLILPILIFGANSVTLSGEAMITPLALLAAILITCLTLAPLGIVGALKIGVLNG